jgi:hypothetical protein
MKSTSETSYGARIGNADKLLTAINSFGDYQPQKPELSIADFSDKIDKIKSKNTTVASNKQSYSLAVDNRKQLFTKDQFSITKLLSPINATVKTSFGRNSKEATDVASIIAKIRGANTKSSTKATTDQASVSQSYQSYSSKTQFFADLLAYLNNFGADYNPSNAKTTLVELTSLHTNSSAANSNVMNTFSIFVTNNDNRIVAYKDLSQVALRIKDNVRAQYGNDSTQYKLIKGLVI